MKHIILIALFLISSNVFSQSKAYISGKIKNNTKDSISIIIDDGIRGTNQEFYKSRIDSKGRFKIIVPLTKSKEATLNTNKENIPIFITPNDSIYCTFDDDNIYGSISFKGNNANHYNYFIEYYNNFGLIHGYFFKPGYADVFNMKPVEFKKYRKEKVKKDLLFLKNYSNEHLLSKEFNRYAKVEIKYSYYYGLLSYHNFKKYFKKIDEKLPKNFYDDINNKLFNHDEYLGSYNYISSTNMYIQELNMDEYTTPQSYFPKGILVSSKVLSGKTLFNYQLNLLTGMLKTDASTKLKDSLVSDFLKKCPYQIYNSVIASNYKKSIIANNKVIPFDVLNSIFETEDEKEISFKKILKKHKNTVIYIDVWASWCGPCKIEMPYSLALKDKFKNDDITFIYLSIDNKKELWKKAIKNWGIKGEHYLMKDGLKSTFARHFNILGVPHYILIDKNGKIIFPAAPRPSLKSIEPSIKVLLKNK